MKERKMLWLWLRCRLKDVFPSCLASPSGFLKDAKSVCLKTMPFSLCQRRLLLYIRLFFYFDLCGMFFFFFHMIMKRYSYFLYGLTIYFELDVLCKRSFMKKCEHIRAQISSLLHVYKCVCTCIFVCV